MLGSLASEQACLCAKMGTALPSANGLSLTRDSRHAALVGSLPSRPAVSKAPINVATTARRGGGQPAPLGPGSSSGPSRPPRDVATPAHSAIPAPQGLFNPENDKDACGVGFVGELSKRPSRKCVTDALKMLNRMSHRGACGCETNTGAWGARCRRLPPIRCALRAPGSSQLQRAAKLAAVRGASRSGGRARRPR